jgi:hypothetical protein
MEVCDGDIRQESRIVAAGRGPRFSPAWSSRVACKHSYVSACVNRARCASCHVVHQQRVDWRIGKIAGEINPRHAACSRLPDMGHTKPHDADVRG